MSIELRDTPLPSPFHHGEHLVQSQLGARDIEDWARKVIRDHMPEQHRAFHTALPFLVIAARDSLDRPWVTILEGPDGFVTSPNPRELSIAAVPPLGDALHGALSDGADIGVLGIELSSRRRNRLNGRATHVTRAGFDLSVDQTFGNCPQYIHERDWHRVSRTRTGQSTRSPNLSAEQKALISASDTFFIASGYRGAGENPAYGLDASHRGGAPGFVEVLNSRQLRFPDYAGNNHFNTIGNLLVDPRAGFLFVDFETGSLLQLSGSATIDWDGPEVHATPGAQRLITLNIEEVVETRSALRLRWKKEQTPSQNLRLVERIRETDDVTSFVFAHEAGDALIPFKAGQYLPIQLEIPGMSGPVARTYSLSNAPGQNTYRITVKREPLGVVSQYLHEHVQPGDKIEGLQPSGEFVLSSSDRPLVLISAGIGVTPLISMLHSIADQTERPVLFLHGARNSAQHAMAQELRDLISRNPNIQSHTAYSQPRGDDQFGLHFDSEGRIDRNLLERLLSDRIDAEYYVCGPAAFANTIANDLERMTIPPERIYTEAFG